MNILLINPPFYRILRFYNRYFPFALVSLATFLKANGYANVTVYDVDFNENPDDIDYSNLPCKYPRYLDSFKGTPIQIWAEVEETIRKFAPDVVGISIWTTSAASSFFTARIVKKAKPECVVVVGGPHATVKADNILKICPDVDYVISGEGEYALLDFLSALDKRHLDLTSISGLSCRKGGNILHNPSRRPTSVLDQFPFPDRKLLINEAARYNSEDMGLIMTSRGCPYSCAYCSTHTGQVSYRSPDHILAEIYSIKDNYGTTQFTFKDDSFTVNSKRVTELCNRLIQQKAGITWECNTRVNLVNEPMLRLMRKAGCYFIKVGIESGSERILKEMNKGISLEQIRYAAKLFRKVGIHWTGYFMIGVPGETEADIRQTIDFLTELRPDFACIGVYEPFPGTPMFEEGIRRNLVKPDMTLEDFYSTLPNNYYKKYPHKQTDQISQKRFAELESEMKDVIRHYNRNFVRVVKMACAKSHTYWKEPKLLRDDIVKFLSY